MSKLFEIPEPDRDVTWVDSQGWEWNYYKSTGWITSRLAIDDDVVAGEWPGPLRWVESFPWREKELEPLPDLLFDPCFGFVYFKRNDKWYYVRSRGAGTPEVVLSIKSEQELRASLASGVLKPLRMVET